MNFWPQSVHFRRDPPHFPKAHALKYGHGKFGNDRMYICGECATESDIESSFWGTGWVAKGDFIRYSSLYPYIFESGTLPSSKAHALSYTHSKVGNDQMQIGGEMTSGR